MMDISKNKNELFLRTVHYLKSGIVRLETDKGIFSLCDSLSDGDEYICENSVARFRISVFDKGGETVYKTVEVTCKTDLTLYSVSFVMDEVPTLQELVFYKSFINAPAAGFLRCGKEGFYTGVENPFFSVVRNDGRIVISYEPSLLLKAGESYESDAHFMGAYIPCGEPVAHGEPVNLEAMKTGIRRTRFFDPCSEVLLDRAEIKSMRAFVDEYYNVINRQFDNILYYFFYPHTRLVTTSQQEQKYLEQIDRFARMQGDLIVFNPQVNTTLPTEEKPYWELLPQGSPAKRIFDYATQKGLRCGYYMGCACNGEGGNAALLPYMPQRLEWKKQDRYGNIASENCLACDDYLDWWYTVQENTIAKYNLGYWAWDPGPGNGNDCFSQHHGHIPGKGEYKGWRNSLKLLNRLKTRFPDLFLQSFYGRKEYGLWGFRYFSQHEVYWEQTLLPGATLHRDFSDYRINAHGMRLQNLWSMQYRFLPAQLGHGLVTRMGESYFDPDLDKANDLLGWKYSLISAIAYCGSVTHCNLPDRLEHLPDMENFYRKWIGWAREHYEYCQYATPIADDVTDGVIDGIARINRDKGQLFLFNSSPQAVRKQMKLDRGLGFDTEKSFYFHVIYCERLNIEKEPPTYRYAYKMGDILDITLPPYGAVVLEMADTPTQKRIDAIPCISRTVSDYRLPLGEAFSCQAHAAYDAVTLTADVYFSSAIKAALKNAAVPNEQFIYEKMDAWKQKGLPFNFTTSFPNRLLLYIPFRGVKMPRQVALSINRQQVPIEVFRLKDCPTLHYAYIEDYLLWDRENEFELRLEGLAENSFMGIYFEFPNADDGIGAPQAVIQEKQILPSEHFDRSLVIDTLSVTPNVIPDTDCEITVRVVTKVPYEKIQSVYFLLPTKPQMPRLSYDSKEDCWVGYFKTGNRRSNIFCNTEVYAWIKAKDGGIGPKTYHKIEVTYAYQKNDDHK